MAPQKKKQRRQDVTSAAEKQQAISERLFGGFTGEMASESMQSNDMHKAAEVLAMSAQTKVTKKQNLDEKLVNSAVSPERISVPWKFVKPLEVEKGQRERNDDFVEIIKQKRRDNKWEILRPMAGLLRCDRSVWLTWVESKNLKRITWKDIQTFMEEMLDEDDRFIFITDGGQQTRCVTEIIQEAKEANDGELLEHFSRLDFLASVQIYFEFDFTMPELHQMCKDAQERQKMMAGWTYYDKLTTCRSLFSDTKLTACQKGWKDLVLKKSAKLFGEQWLSGVQLCDQTCAKAKQLAELIHGHHTVLQVYATPMQITVAVVEQLMKNESLWDSVVFESKLEEEPSADEILQEKKLFVQAYIADIYDRFGPGMLSKAVQENIKTSVNMSTITNCYTWIRGCMVPEPIWKLLIQVAIMSKNKAWSKAVLKKSGKQKRKRQKGTGQGISSDDLPWVFWTTLFAAHNTMPQVRNCLLSVIASHPESRKPSGWDYTKFPDEIKKRIMNTNMILVVLALGGFSDIASVKERFDIHTFQNQFNSQFRETINAAKKKTTKLQTLAAQLQQKIGTMTFTAKETAIKKVFPHFPIKFWETLQHDIAKAKDAQAEKDRAGEELRIRHTPTLDRREVFKYEYLSEPDPAGAASAQLPAAESGAGIAIEDMDGLFDAGGDSDASSSSSVDIVRQEEVKPRPDVTWYGFTKNICNFNTTGSHDALVLQKSLPHVFMASVNYGMDMHPGDEPANSCTAEEFIGIVTRISSIIGSYPSGQQYGVAMLFCSYQQSQVFYKAFLEADPPIAGLTKLPIEPLGIVKLHKRGRQNPVGAQTGYNCDYGFYIYYNFDGEKVQCETMQRLACKRRPQMWMRGNGLICTHYAFPREDPHKILEGQADATWKDQFMRRWCYTAVHCWTLPGDTIVDMCCGSGTLSVVALRMGRNVIAVDRNAAAIKYTLDRLRTLKRTAEAYNADDGSAWATDFFSL